MKYSQKSVFIVKMLAYFYCILLHASFPNILEPKTSKNDFSWGLACPKTYSSSKHSPKLKTEFLNAKPNERTIWCCEPFVMNRSL